MVCVNNSMENYSDNDEHRSPDYPIWRNQTAEPLTLNLEVYDDKSSDGSSEALEIVTSENELTESSGREHKRKRRDNDSDMPEVLNNMEEELEKQLDAKAAKSNLTVANVKNILKHVITNEHVLAMVRRTIKDEDTSDMIDDETEEEFPYEPKLTRAKAKELLMTQPTISWPITPVKKQSTSKCHVLIEQELSEDSSDEEYRPNEEEQEQSDEEKENESAASDLDSQPTTPLCPSTPKSLMSSDCATQTSWTEDGLFKIPQENIGQRTRSKLSLSDTPLETIEKAFVPPDITTDMYDSECDDEDWKDFLKNFTEPLTTDVNDAFDDDEADPEYNVLADEEEQTVDKEELRVDRAVKVSRKELNLLVAELFEYADMMSSDDEDTRTQQQEVLTLPEQDLPPEDPLPVEENATVETLDIDVKEEESVVLSPEQKLLLDQQMRKHVQLTTQHFIQTYGHPQLSHWSAECKSILVSLKYLGGANSKSAFLAANLAAALELIDTWERKLSAASPESAEIISFIQREINMATELKRKKQFHQCQFPPQLLEVVSRSEVFLYPLLLPPQPFRCDGFCKPFYLLSEDALIAIGLEQFEEYVKATSSPPSSSSLSSSNISKGSLTKVLSLITTYMLPGKDPKYLYFHVRKSRLINSNPIQYYFQHNRAPRTDHYVIPFTPALVRPPNKQPMELLPGIWREYVYTKKGKSQDRAASLLLLHS